tara:strand:+ start:584 stop:781 length:198 start_codon:yes stop_codon:yes gene_type:complete
VDIQKSILPVMPKKYLTKYKGISMKKASNGVTQLIFAAVAGLLLCKMLSPKKDGYSKCGGQCMAA